MFCTSKANLLAFLADLALRPAQPMQLEDDGVNGVIIVVVQCS